MKPFVFLALASLPGLRTPGAPDDADLAAIERAVLDYAEAYYEVKPEYVERGIHAELVKVGYLLKEDGSYDVKPMDFQGFMDMVMWFASSDRVPEAGPKDVEILDAQDQTALVKLTGSWGSDYMQLAKFDGRWQTKHVIWQRAPRERTEAERAADHEAIERAVLDYAEAFYEVKPELAERSVHPELTKLGFARSDASAAYQAMAMSYDQLLALAATWNEDGSVPADAPKEVRVLDSMDHTACAKLTAHWGTDYMHLVEIDGAWKILHVLWQSAPPEATSEG